MRSLIRVAPTTAVILGAAAFILAVGLVEGLTSREHWLTSARQQVKNLSLSLAQDTDRTVQSIDLVLSGIVEHLKVDRDATTVQVYLKHRLLALGAARNLVVTDARGRTILNALDPPTPVSIADKPFFAWHRDHDDDVVHVDEPTLSEFGDPILPITRRYNNPDGSFAGVVEGALDLDKVRSFFDAIDIGSTGSISLWNDAGYLITRRPFAPGILTRQYHDSELLRAARRGGSVIHSRRSPLDGVERIVSIEHVERYPSLMVAAAIGFNEALAPWWRDATIHFGILSPAALGLCGLGIALELRGRKMRTSAATLAESEMLFRLLAENTGDLIILGHDDGRRSYISPAIERLLGYGAAEFNALGLRRCVHPDDIDALYAATRTLDAPGREATIVYRSRHADGRWIWIEGVFRRIAASGNAPTIVSTFRDVSARVAQAEALKVAKDQAEAANAAKTDFLAAMSHEIRTPLNGILGYTDLLLEDASIRDERRSRLQRIFTAGQALRSIIDDILDFSKIEAGQIDLLPRPFRPAILADNASSIVRGAASGKGLQLDIDIASDVPPVLVGDEDRLRQILLNLLSNAIKFTRVGSVKMIVSAASHTDETTRLRFAFVDTGIGIAEDKRTLLFKRFSQVDGSIRREYGGTGLGLAICKSLVEAMGGTIGAESEVDRGSTFWFEVPLPTGSAVEAAGREIPDGDARRALSILLVEDNEINQDIARVVLEGAGHRVDVVDNGASAVAAVRSGAYDLVLMDVQMPIMDGFEATRRIRCLDATAARSIPIIAMTANVLSSQVRELRAVGVDAHVGKPFKREQLLSAIASVTPVARAREPEVADAGRDVKALHVHDLHVHDLHVHDLHVRDLDVVVLGEFIGMVGDAQTERFLQLALSQVDSLLHRARQYAAASELASGAHAAVSAVGTLGLESVATRLRALETASLANVDTTACVDALSEAHTSTKLALTNWLQVRASARGVAPVD